MTSEENLTTGIGVHPCTSSAPDAREARPRSRTLPRAIREAVDAEIGRTLCQPRLPPTTPTSSDKNEFKILRPSLHRIAAKAVRGTLK